MQVQYGKRKRRRDTGMNRMHRTHTEDQAGSKYSSECLSNAQNNLACGKSYSVALFDPRACIENAECGGKEVYGERDRTETK